MAKRKATEDVDTGERDGSSEHVELLKFETLDEGVLLMSHSVPKGSVVELTEEEAANHRSHGVRLADVALDDTREVFQCRERRQINGD